ncbi:type II toxin-antitoxin system death-on-curing family toxin [Luteolibacter sp. SL250]|uniref:type II toxin-antitoxin system death-on-curing family toxin n=1 Tax=Luteolibacter sp. SL250 TaxID=2995170 RepID=UPI00226ECA0B|nr:type II toxin-antitoxin system death-on-curing family toxin [Luteolibacter sp. SL250]WAC20126.1 type II toxin-antitoxin system death-on-curing family toxin [Luteolibacter sp. SL250]
MSAPEPEWVAETTLRLVHQRQLAEHGGLPGIRDEGLFLSAVARPQQLWCYGDPPPDFCQLAASYAHGLAKNHPFLDGNKRTAAIACELFLNLNGVFFLVGEEEKYPHFLALAAGDHTEESFAGWLRSVTSPPA